MEFIGGNRRERPVVVGQRRTVEISVGAVGTTFWRRRQRKTAAAAARRRAGAVEIAKGEVAVVPRGILSGRDHECRLEAIPDRRLVPDRMWRAPIEFGPQVAARIAHDRVVVAQRGRERVEFRGRLLVWCVGLAGLDRAPWRFHADKAVPCAEGSALRRHSGGLDQRLELSDRSPAREAVWFEIVARPYAEI